MDAEAKKLKELKEPKEREGACCQKRLRFAAALLFLLSSTSLFSTRSWMLGSLKELKLKKMRAEGGLLKAVH
jgi:hypothetical protein